MRRRATLLAAIFLSTTASAQESPSYEEIMNAARNAFEAEDWRAVADNLDAAQAQRPYSLYLTRNRILAYTMLDDSEAALAIASKAAERGLSLTLAGHPGFEKLTSLPEFESVASAMDENAAPLGETKTVLLLADDELLPETLAPESGKKEFFIGSVRTGKIIRLSCDGGEAFAIAKGGVYDLETDGKNVWAAVNTASPYEKPLGEKQAASIVSFSLKNGSVSGVRFVSEPQALLGDLEMTPVGLIASDSVTPRLFILRNGDETPSLFSDDPRYVNLQGMAYDAKRNRLFVADYLAGLFSVEMETGAATLIDNKADAHLGGIDGLYLHDGDLVGIQNGATPQRIVRIRLNKAGDEADSLVVIQRALPEWREPTNGKVIGDTLYYIGTSNWPAYGGDGTLNEDVERAPLSVMTAPL